MESRGKRSRRYRVEEDDELSTDLDRISALPDSILAHILSFLDTRSAIKTSLLAKRYHLLWTMSPCLDFSFSDYLTDRFESYDGRAFSPVKNSSLVTFESFVNRVFQLREPSKLVKFRMSLHKYVGSAFMDSCVYYAARHNVQHLRLRGFIKQNPVPLPKLLLNSSSLISLHLHNATSNSIELPKSVSLPNLKHLRLKNFVFSDRNFTGEVFLGCPSLEVLVLGKCSIRPENKLKVLDVNCSVLKSLEIRYWRSPWRCFDEHVINVRAPNLASFLFRGHVVRVNFEGGLPCVNEAFVDMSFPTACSMVSATERKQKSLEGFLGLLRQLRNVGFLSLSLKTLEVMDEPRDLQSRAPIIFENLRLIKFAAKCKSMEVKMPVDNLKHLLEKASTDVLMFDVSKKRKLVPKISKARKRDSRNIYLKAHIVHFLLESSPSLQIFSVEIPSESSLLERRG